MHIVVRLKLCVVYGFTLGDVGLGVVGGGD